MAPSDVSSHSDGLVESRLMLAQRRRAPGYYMLRTGRHRSWGLGAPRLSAYAGHFPKGPGRADGELDVRPGSDGLTAAPDRLAGFDDDRQGSSNRQTR